MISEIENKSEEAEQGSKEIKEHMEKRNEGKLIEMVEKQKNKGINTFKKQYEEGIDEYKASVQFYEKIETQNVEIIEKIVAIERKIRNAEREIEKLRPKKNRKR